MEKEKEKEQLRVFGCGLALLIPFFVALHAAKPLLGFWPFSAVLLGGFTVIMVIISKAAGRGSLASAGMLAAILAAGIYSFISHGGMLSIVFCLLAVVILFMVMFRIELLKPVFAVWMKAAMAISNIITGLILALVFYTMFAIAGMALRILNKDILNLRKAPGASTYWIRRPRKALVKENCLRQF